MTRERPILFSGAMVRAILDGRKTQTRRMVKPQPVAIAGINHGKSVTICETLPSARAIRCPYGAPGDRLWVRETWCESSTKDGRGKVLFRADGEISDEYGPWRSSMFMPRWAGRITLEITDVRAERLQEISEADAMAEGVEIAVRENGALDPFRALWDSINAKRAPWASNPWVWAITFRRAES